MNWLIDVVALLGLFCLALGVFLEFGTGFSLISAGIYLFLSALLAAHNRQSESN